MRLSPGLQSPPPPSEFETLAGVLAVLRRRIRTILLAALAVLVLGTAVCFLLTPKYSSTAVIEVDREEHTQNVSADAANMAPTADELKAETETDISILESDGLALDVIRALDLTKVKPFSKDIDPNEEGLPLDRAPRTRERLITRFEKNLSVISPPDTRLINVTFTNPDRATAAAVANTLTQKFIEGSMERRHNSTVQSSYWLRRELADLKKQVEDSEQKVADYQRKTGLAGVQAPTTVGGSTVADARNTVTDRLFSLNQELTAAESNRISAETVYHLVKTQDPEVVLGLGSMSVSSGSGGGGGALTGDGGISLVRSLRAQQADLSQQYSSAAVKYGVNNPRLTQLQQQLNAVQEQMQAELGRISKRAENAYEYARNNEEAIRQEFQAQQGAANAMADDSVHLEVLSQEANSNRTLYESLFSQLQSADLASGVRATRVSIVDPARPGGKPAFPDYVKVFAVLTALALLLGVSAGFVQESLDETVRRPQDLRIAPSVALLGHIPRLTAKELHAATVGNNRLGDLRKAPFSEAFRGLRQAVKRRLPGPGSKTLLVTSAVGGEGKSTVVFNLGAAFAWQGSRVLLVDCDLRHPDLHRLFGCPLEPGVGDITIPVSDATVLRVVQHTEVSNLHILPAGRAMEFPAEFFESQTFDALLQVCSSRYDYVLLDSPPLLSVTDASVLAGKVTGTLAVVRSRKTTGSELSSLVSALEEVGSPLVGVLLNNVRSPLSDGFHAFHYASLGGSVHEAV